MTDLANLYTNMTHVCEQASITELETMLRVIAGELDRRHRGAADFARLAANELALYRHAKRAAQHPTSNPDAAFTRDFGARESGST